jgi:RNA polymerase sigma factor for flagellar operon FliA
MNTAETSNTNYYLDQWAAYLKDRSVDARNEIVLQYTDLVRRIALRFKGSYSQFGQLDDMINQGMIALIDAVEKFDPHMGNKFETFATLKIKGSIIDLMRKQDWVPRNQRNLARELDQVYGDLYATNGCPPSNDQIAEKMGLTIPQLERVLQQRHNSILLSYEETINEQMNAISPIGVEENGTSPEKELLYGELKEALVRAIGQLNEKEKLVVSLYYYENLKLKEIAAILGITESRVSQIHSASVIKMKHTMSSYR